VTVDGRLFHALAAATSNALSPSDDLLVAGMMVTEVAQVNTNANLRMRLHIQTSIHS